MQNYEQFMKELGIEIPEDKKDALSAKMKENYKTVAEYNKAAEKRDEYKTSLDDVQEKLKAFEEVDVEDLKGQITTLTTQLQDEKNAREKDAARFELEKTVDTFMGEKKFINDITAGSLREKLQQKINELEIVDSVTLCGRTSDIVSALMEHDLFIMTSNYEGMPNSLMEAMGVGVPCISTKCPTGPSELLGEDERGLLI